jgi:hypothetical protein
MQRLPIHLLKPGMQIAKEVRNRNGLVLVSQTATLDEKIISRLENLGIRKVVVSGCPVEDLADSQPKSLSEKLADMETGFSYVKNDPIMERFRVLVKNHFIRRHQEMIGEIGETSQGVLEGKDPGLAKADAR